MIHEKKLCVEIYPRQLIVDRLKHAQKTLFIKSIFYLVESFLDVILHRFSFK